MPVVVLIALGIGTVGAKGLGIGGARSTHFCNTNTDAPICEHIPRDRTATAAMNEDRFFVFFRSAATDVHLAADLPADACDRDIE